MFEPHTRERAIESLPLQNIKQRLLIIYGHNSHIRADSIAHYMKNNIDLLIMPPHCSYLLQPLNIGVFTAFKRAHSGETDAVSRLNTQRIFRFKWLQMFQRIRFKAIIFINIRTK